MPQKSTFADVPPNGRTHFNTNPNPPFPSGTRSTLSDSFMDVTQHQPFVNQSSRRASLQNPDAYLGQSWEEYISLMSNNVPPLPHFPSTQLPEHQTSYTPLSPIHVSTTYQYSLTPNEPLSTNYWNTTYNPPPLTPQSSSYQPHQPSPSSAPYSQTSPLSPIPYYPSTTTSTTPNSLYPPDPRVINHSPSYSSSSSYRPNTSSGCSSSSSLATPQSSQILPASTGTRRRFTDAENEALLRGFMTHGPSWSRIARDPLLNTRRSTDLRDRFRNAFPDVYKNRSAYVKNPPNQS